MNCTMLSGAGDEAINIVLNGCVYCYTRTVGEWGLPGYTVLYLRKSKHRNVTHHCNRTLESQNITRLVTFINEPRCEKTCLRGFRPGPTNRAVQPQKMTGGLKSRI